jgi:DNA-nicking Smr family endonuclease
VAGRRLGPDERAVWSKVASTIRPIEGRKPVNLETAPASSVKMTGFHPSAVPQTPKAKPFRTRQPANTLDAGWDRRLAQGSVAPDRVIDLHGESLASAHAHLDRALAGAILAGDRLVLLVTGKQARENPRLPPTSRGVIRASIHDWLTASRHSRHIAAVRAAHPRHGGAGALYVILRRAR